MQLERASRMVALFTGSTFLAWVGPSVLERGLSSPPEASYPVAWRELSHPNEPVGYSRFAENDGSVLNSRKTTDHSLGEWSAREEGARSRLILAEDPTAPVSPPGIVRTRFPARWPAGRGPVSWAGWDSAGPVEKSGLYISLWLRISGSDYENQAVGTKMGFLGYGQDPAVGARNQGYFLLAGPGERQRIDRAFRLRFYQQGFVERVLRQNVDRAALLSAGAWHHIEVLAGINSVGAKNGVFKMWVDGHMIMNYRDMVYATRDRPFKFTSWKWNPTWGGRGGVRTRDDFMEFDHIYLSGLP